MSTDFKKHMEFDEKIENINKITNNLNEHLDLFEYSIDGIHWNKLENFENVFKESLIFGRCIVKKKEKNRS